MRPSSIRIWTMTVVTTAAGLALGWWGTGPFVRHGAAPPGPTAGPVKPARPVGQGTDSLAAGIAGIWASGDASAQTAAAVVWARALAPADFGRALEALDRLPAHAAQGMAKRAILKRWAAQDPAAALRWALGHDPDLVGTVAAEGIRNNPAFVESVFAVLSAFNPGAQHSEQNANLTHDAFSQMFKVLATRDREAAMILLTRREHLLWEGRLYGIGPSLRAMARQDPAWMLERAESLPAGDRASIRASVARALADADPVQAIEWARSQPDSPELLKALLDQTKDVPALIAGLATLSAEEQASMRLGGLPWGNSDPEAVVDTLEARGNHLSPELFQSFLRGSAVSLPEADNPGALANRLLALSADPNAFPLIGFTDSWARRAPDAARTWVSALTDETQRANALEAIENATRPPEEEPVLSPVQQALARADVGDLEEPHALLALDPADRRRVLDAAWAREPPEKNQPDEDTHVFASAEPVLRQISQHYPAETARWLSDTLTAESTPALIPVLTSTAAHWASEDPRAAAAWANALPPGDARAWAAINVFDQWRHFDESGARVWWESLPAEERARTSRQKAPENP
ncbi:MAG: hypothetical protein ACKV19_08515 [Verrucomicrobiales bacterium]